MPINTEQLRQRYRALSEDELLRLDRTALTEIAQKCYDEEIKRRGISVPLADSVDDDSDAAAPTEERHAMLAVPKDDEFFDICSFANSQGASADAADARNFLEEAGIPSRVDMVRVEPEPNNSRPYNEYRVLVPSTLMLHAKSVLDQQVFNPKEESDWKTHLESLTDDQLLQLNEDDICAGLIDRATRLRKAYTDERRRRQL